MLSRKFPHSSSFFKISTFFAFTLDTFGNLTKYFLETLLKNFNSKYEVLTECILTCVWGSCFIFWAETFFNYLKKSFCKIYLTTEGYLQLETSIRNQYHRCVKILTLRLISNLAKNFPITGSLWWSNSFKLYEHI